MAFRYLVPRLDHVARTGNMGRALVFLALGAFALGIAFAETEADMLAALENLTRRLWGILLLLLLGLGSLVYAAYRCLQAVFDTESFGRAWSGLLERGFYVAIGLGYGIVGLYALALPFGFDLGERDAQYWAELVMAQPLGRVLVIGGGLIIIVGGLYDIWYGLGRRFAPNFRHERLGPIRKSFTWGVAFYGHLARGLVYGLVGALLVQAGVLYDPERAVDLAEAFAAVLERPFGRPMLAAAGAGFLSYGAFCIMLSLYRKSVRRPTRESRINETR